MVRHRLLALLALLALLGPALTQDKGDDAPAPPAGAWKLLLPMVQDAGKQPIWLLSFEKKGDAWSGKVIDTAARWPKGTLKNIVVAKNVFRFTVETPRFVVPCELTLPTDGKGDVLRGTTAIRKNVMPVELVRTTIASLDAYDLIKEDLAKAPLGAEAVRMALTLLSKAEENKAKPAEARAWAEKAVRSAELYGPAWQRDIILMVAEVLTEDQKGFESIALQYARRAERLLEGKEPPAAQKKVLSVLAAALEKTGKADEAKETLAKIKKLDFRIRPKAFAGRKGKSDRAVLVELFTGAQCPPCVAADLAFDALAKTYRPGEVVLLQYHVHVPGPDPLTNPDSEARMGFYEKVEGTPTILFNGRPAAGGGGEADDAAEKYEEYQEVINPLLEQEAEAKIALTATRKADKVSITADVTDAKKTGDDVRLRIVLVEKEVAYKGKNGLPTHHYVVRHMPGGDGGTVVKDKAQKGKWTVDLADVKKKLGEYLEKSNAKRPFPDKERPMELKDLKVVAFIQDDRTNDVLQAAMVDVKAEE